MTGRSVARAALMGLWATVVACGARSTLQVHERGSGGGGEPPCEEGDTQPCGSDAGSCELGLQICHDGAFGLCQGQTEPREEECNGLDDDCDGEIDESFGVGAACDGADSDLCNDDIMSCEGCSLGPDDIEICNGFDDNCNGVVDADCEVGDCHPSLQVVGSTPSSPTCIDFPVTAGSEGSLHYPCEGGEVTATLGGIEFTGTVHEDVVSIDGVAVVTGPDGCLWETSHHIGGHLSSGELSYLYDERVLVMQPFCWIPCYELGTVSVSWSDLQ